MLEISNESTCIYCSKNLLNLNHFNKRMHLDTCKVRKLIESNSSFNLNINNQLEDYVILGDSCTYCYKPFKDFKSDFNKRLHLKCCKIKREAYEYRLSLSKRNQQQQQQLDATSNSIDLNLSTSMSNTLSSQSAPSTPTAMMSIGDSCLFCAKPLANLNEFNKKMHVENCKIRKTIESNMGNDANNSMRKSANTNLKDENFRLNIELGSNCMYCGKSFMTLSEFNKRLHFEHCKLRKRKYNELNLSSTASPISSSIATGVASTSSAASTSTSASNGTTPATISINLTSYTPTTSHVAHSLNTSMPNLQQISTPVSNVSRSNSNNNNNNLSRLEYCDSCMFCSRSLRNLSNFNKNVHIETCKLKQIKKANAMKIKEETSLCNKRSKRAKKAKLNSSFQPGTVLTNIQLTPLPNEAHLMAQQNDSSNTNNSTNTANGNVTADTNNVNTNANNSNNNNTNCNVNQANGNNNTQFETTSITLTSLDQLTRQHSALLHDSNHHSSTSSTHINTIRLPVQLNAQLDPNTNTIFI